MAIHVFLAVINNLGLIKSFAVGSPAFVADVIERSHKKLCNVVIVRSICPARFTNGYVCEALFGALSTFAPKILLRLNVEYLFIKLEWKKIVKIGTCDSEHIKKCIIHYDR